MMSPCGVDCSTCRIFQKECNGCFEIQGKAFWTEFIDDDICAIYDCAVNEKKLKHCGSCGELPCRHYFDLADPSYPEEKHIEDTNRRAVLLKELYEQEKKEKKGSK